MRKISLMLLIFGAFVKSCPTLFGMHRCPSHERSEDLNAFVENSMNRMFPLTYASFVDKSRFTNFRLDTIVAPSISTCSILRILREGNLIQFICSINLPKIYINVERKVT
ncbi:hypothetical protein SprV_0602237800 [Sparganum proliferum]